MSDPKCPLKLPILDVSQPSNPSSLSELLKSCKEWGFFLIANHGISQQLYTKNSFFDQIFSLPPATKLKLGPSSSSKSYTPKFIASPFYEGFLVSRPCFFHSAQTSAIALFGQEAIEFSKTFQEYGDILTKLSKKIIEVLLMSLGDDLDNKFQGEFEKGHGYLKIISYAPPQENELEKEVEGLGMHTDMACLTILYPDSIGGLQVKSGKGEWLDVALLEHRVVLRQPRKRFSLAFFWSFDDEVVICASDEVVGEGNVRIFRPFVCGDYLKFREDKEKYDLVARNVRVFARMER